MEEGLLPLHHDLTGVWMLDHDRSQSMDAIYTAMNVSWWSRLMITGGNATIVHTPNLYRCSESRAFGKSTIDLSLVKKPADLPSSLPATPKNSSQSQAQQRSVARNSGAGRLVIDTNYGKELSTHEERWLENRLFMVVSLMVKRTGEAPITVTRYWRRVESRAQQRVGDAAWIVSGIPLGHLPTPTAITTNDNTSNSGSNNKDAAAATATKDDVADSAKSTVENGGMVTIQIGHLSTVSQSVLAAAASGRPGYQLAPQIHQAHAPCGPPCRCPKSAKQTLIRKICN